MTKVITRDISDNYFTIRDDDHIDYSFAKYFCGIDRRGNKFFVIFSNNQLHDYWYKKFGFSSVESAGYIVRDGLDGYYCNGESTTLMVKARQEDTQILQEWLTT